MPQFWLYQLPTNPAGCLGTKRERGVPVCDHGLTMASCSATPGHTVCLW